MTWTYAQVKAADAALVPAMSDPGQAAMALNAQTHQLTGQAFSWRAAKSVARESATADWSRIVARARQTPTLPPATPTDQAILAAINAVESADSDLIDPNDAGSWGAWQAGLSALHGVGDLSDATLAALNALPTPTVPVWPVRLTDQDVTAARSLP